MHIIHYGYGNQSEEWITSQNHPSQHIRIYLINGGTGMYRDVLETFSLQKKWLYILPAQQGFEIVQDSSDPICCMYLYADIFPYIVQRPVKMDPSNHPEIMETLRLMQMQLDRSSDHGCFSAFGMALFQLLIRDGFLAQKIDRSLLDTESVSITSNVQEISRKAGYSSEHFIRTFSRSAGITPYQYLLSQRMNEAVSLMQQGFTLEEIAVRVGYANAKSFSGAFKRHYGMAPQYYRRHFLNRES